jgi:aminoglycoside N3'-acetyltransferase
MDSFLEKLVAALLAVCGLTLVVLLVFVVLGSINTTEGTVTDKYFDNEDLICSKGCVVTPDCYTIVVESEPVWAETACVSKSEYDSINIGDYFKEDE